MFHNSVDPNTLHLIGIGCTVLAIVGQLITANYYASGGDEGSSNDAGFRVTFVLLIILVAWVIYFFATGGHFSGKSPLEIQ